MTQHCLGSEANVAPQRAADPQPDPLRCPPPAHASTHPAGTTPHTHPPAARFEPSAVNVAMPGCPPAAVAPAHAAALPTAPPMPTTASLAAGLPPAAAHTPPLPPAAAAHTPPPTAASAASPLVLAEHLRAAELEAAHLRARLAQLCATDEARLERAHLDAGAAAAALRAEACALQSDVSALAGDGVLFWDLWSLSSAGAWCAAAAWAALRLGGKGRLAWVPAALLALRGAASAFRAAAAVNCRMVSW